MENRKDSYLYPLYFLTIVVLFIPQFQSYIGLLIEQALSLFLITSSLYLILVVYNGKIKLLHLSVILTYVILILISLNRGVNISGFSIRDIFELSKPAYLGLTFVLSFSMNWNERRIKSYFNFLIFCLFVLAIFGIFESTTSVGNTVGHTLYKDLRGGVQYKAVGSFISPYVFASILMIPFFYFFSLLFSSFNLKCLLFTVFFLVAIILTQSRTIILSLGIALILIWIFNLFSSAYIGRRKINMSILFLFGCFIFLLPFIITFIENNLRYIYTGLNVVFSNITDLERLIYSKPSISNRYEQMVFVLNNIDAIPLLGANIGKELVNPESFYALYLYRVGLLGMMIHFILLTLTFIKSKMIASIHKKDVVLNSIFVSIVFYIMSIPFAYASSALNDQVRSGFIFYMLMGIVFKFYDVERKNENIYRNTNLR